MKKALSNINGIIVVNKPQNWTSHDCVAVMRRAVGVKRIGHTGTLDPMATGVLPVCIGTSARIMEYLDLDNKTYRCTMRLGITTDTEDVWGEVLTETDPSNVTEEQIREVFSTFVGEIEQIPPKYSALKVNGKKLYEYARAGQEVEIKSRKITISSIDIEKIEGNEITFVVVCSKGTYVRTICKDIGDKLGCGAAMSALTRIASGIFTLEEAIDIEKIKEMSKEEIVEKLYPTDYPLIHFGRINMTAVQAKDFVNGKRLKRENLEIVDASKHEEMYNIYYGDEFLGVAQFDRHILKSHKVFNVRMQNESI